MEPLYSPQEILRIAIKVEENGKKLYSLLGDKAVDKKLKEMWEFLRNQEEEHRQTFEGMLDNLSEYIVYEFTRGEYDAYLNAIAENYVFTQRLVEEKIKTWFSSQTEALDFAISIEKESILIYTAFKRYVKPERHSVIDRIIQEEERHLIQLTTLKRQRNS